MIVIGHDYKGRMFEGENQRKRGRGKEGGAGKYDGSTLYMCMKIAC
jgi:hypothetical protein